MLMEFDTPVIIGSYFCLGVIQTLPKCKTDVPVNGICTVMWKRRFSYDFIEPGKTHNSAHCRVVFSSNKLIIFCMILSVSHIAEEFESTLALFHWILLAFMHSCGPATSF